ncbi:MAG: alpha-hydroxy-acid oxidizing protein [Actinomycetota bacterium]|nr:alpha-hydroxy-acid oxidizing protein [Actinomycetota bacterium]
MNTGRWADTLPEAARRVLPPALFGYLVQGAREGVSAAEAVASWDALRLLPRVLRDVRSPAVGTTLLGTQVDLPLGIAPTTLQTMVHPEGEIAMAGGAAGAGSLMVVSSNAGTPFAQIGETGAAWWVQVYLPQDRSLATPMLGRAVAAGARAVVLTVDTPVVGTKHGPSVWDEVGPERLRVNFDPGYESLPGSAKAQDLGPQDIAWLADQTGLPVVVKGVLRADDARRCVSAGASAVWVSNHGGRQLDLALDTASALPAVAAAVGANVEVYVDGGLRTGTHLLLAAALGARAAFVGRLPLFALAVAGADGVRRLLAGFADELTEAMRLAGQPVLAEVDVPPVRGPR